MKPTTIFILPLATRATAFFLPFHGSPPPVPASVPVPAPNPSNPVEYKYFMEPGISDSLGHYDARYFGSPIPYGAHHVALRHLIRSYLTALAALGVDTWLAHGTLLGWWWNGRIMPWDHDLDVQVSSATLEYLGRYHNRTIHSYAYIDDRTGDMINKTYLLDINPFHGMTTRGRGINVIDGRWIDTDNGMFVDITGLKERDAAGQPGTWSCKNWHRYRTRELWPMRVTEFEGVRATVPYDFNKVLTTEYGIKALITTEWEGHRWEKGLKEWVRIPDTVETEDSLRW